MTRAIQFVLLTLVLSVLFGPAGIFVAILLL